MIDKTLFLFLLLRIDKISYDHQDRFNHQSCFFYLKSNNYTSSKSIILLQEQLMQQTRLTPQSKAVLFQLKQYLLRYRLDLKSLIVKSFGEHKAYLNDHEFQSIFRHVDDRVSYDDIERLFNELETESSVSVDLLHHQLCIIKRPDLMLARFEMDQEIEQKLKLALKKTQGVLLKEDPYYVFDLYDANKDERLHIQQLNNLLIGCSKQFSEDLELRKDAIRCLRRYANKKYLAREYFFEIFGMKNILSRVKFDSPPPVQEVQTDDDIIKKLMISRKQYENSSNVLVEQSLNSSVRSLGFQQNFEALKYFRLNNYKKYSEMIGLLEFYINNNQIFEDPEGPKNSNPKYSEKRAQDIFKNKNFSLFEMAESIIGRQPSRIGFGKLVEPKDVIQGSIGDCYFLSSISSIVSKYPQHIHELFLFNVNPIGFYVVRLFNDGEWGNIVLDDKFLCDKYGTPAFARPHTNEIWVMLLEKAWAKINISYQNIDLGSSLQGLVALTGAPSKYYRKEDELVMERIKEAWDKKWIATCSGSQYLNEMKKQDSTKLGLIGKHAYSVHKLVEIIDPDSSQKLTLIKMRNPWGDLEWKGEWSFTCQKWTPKLREELNYKKNPQDGSFFMPWKEFQKYFGSVTVCSMIKGYLNSSLRIKVKRHKSTFVEMKIDVPGNYTISLYQESKRKYKHSQNYKLSEARLIIMKQIPKKKNMLSSLEYITSGNKSTSNVHLSTFLNKGTYFVSAKVAWRIFEQHECVLTSYGPAPVQFSLFTDPSMSKYFKEHLVNSYFNKVRGNKSHYTNIKLDEAYREICVNLEHGIGYIFFGNPTASAFTSTINFKNAKGIKLIKPHSFPLQVRVNADTESLFGLFVSGEGYSYVMEEKVKPIKDEI